MTTKREAAPGPLWLTRPTAAEIVGLSPRHFDDAVRSRLPATAVRGEGRKLRYHAAAVVATWHAYKVEQLAPAGDRRGIGGKDTAGPGDLIEDENAPDSPALERLRMARAIEAELDLEERVRFLVKRQVVIDALKPAAIAMRAAGNRLAKKFGNGAAEIFNDAVNDFTRALVRFATAADANPDGRGDRAGIRPGGADADAAHPHD